jgi:hypothetical protein
MVEKSVRLSAADLQRLAYEAGNVDGIPVRPVPLEIYRHGTFSVKADIESTSCHADGATHPYCGAANESSELSRRNAVLDAINRCAPLKSEDFDDYDVARTWRHP